MCILTTMTNKAVFRAFLGTVYCTSFRWMELLPGNGSPLGPGMPGPPPCRYRPFVFYIVGRGLDPSAAYRRREPQKPLRPRKLGHLPAARGGFLRTAPPSEKRLPTMWGAGRAKQGLKGSAAPPFLPVYKMSTTFKISPSTVNFTLLQAKSSVYTRSGSCW